MHTDHSPISSSSTPSSFAPKSQSKKRKRSIRNPNPNPNPPPSPWPYPKQQQLYSSSLLSALRHLRPSPPTSLRAAVDRSLAAAARGPSRWSRAILSNRSILLKIRRPKVVRTRRSNRSKARKLSEIESRARVLRRLVPGCKKLGLDSLLDEALDYIAALEVQVTAMSMIAGVLTAASNGEWPAMRS